MPEYNPTEEGIIAYQSDLRREDNPYKELTNDTAQFFAWNRGWDLAGTVHSLPNVGIHVL